MSCTSDSCHLFTCVCNPVTKENLGPATDLEDKPETLPQVPSGTPAGPDANLDSPDKSPLVPAGAQSSTQPPSAKSTAKKKTARPKSSRKKIKAPDLETENRGHRDACPSTEDSWRARRTRVATKGGIVAGSFAAEDLFDLKLSEIEHTVQSLFTLLTPPGAIGRAKADYNRVSADAGKIDPDYTWGTDRNVIALPSDAYVQQNSPEDINKFRASLARETGTIFPSSYGHVPKRATCIPRAVEVRSAGEQDVEMESGGSPNQPASSWEYDPDGLDLDRPARAAVAAAMATTSDQTLVPPRIRVSAVSEFSEKNGDEDRARSWHRMRKSA
ncbi:hypothetical protein ON010_g13692 [Phytophthora cinnamomi]|nr:hypothetical protein ON010_g13692 [Phytophthora cinnamomi]